MKHRIEYFIFYAVTRLISCLPFSTAVNIGKQLGRLLYRLSGSRRKITVDNISTSLNISTAEAEIIAKKALENIGMTFAEFIKLPSLEDSFFENNIEVEGFDNFIAARDKGKGVLILSAHIGNWELLGASHQKREGKMSCVYRPTSNPFVGDFIDSIRKSTGLGTIPSKNAARKIMTHLKRGGTAGILLDQHAVVEEAINVDFFGRPAATNYGLALIALKTGSPVVPLFLTREVGSKFKCHYGEPIYPEKSDDLKSDIKKATEHFNKVIEEMIKRYPDQWFWLHRRWKV